jgi:folate-dependent phosphoribosylglycinamide formyltransferase PurN
MDLEVHQAVIDAKDAESGCTIHYVTEEVDGGAVVVQKKVAVEAADTAETLKAKVQVQEGQAFIEAIQKLGGRTMLTYADAGVDIVAGDDLVQLIKVSARARAKRGRERSEGASEASA